MLQVRQLWMISFRLCDENILRGSVNDEKYDEIKHLKKGYVYEYYARIVDNFKDYEKISRMESGIYL